MMCMIWALYNLDWIELIMVAKQGIENKFGQHFLPYKLFWD